MLLAVVVDPLSFECVLLASLVILAEETGVDDAVGAGVADGAETGSGEAGVGDAVAEGAGVGEDAGLT